MGKGQPFCYILETSSFTMFIVEDEKTLVNDPLGSSNTLLVDGVTSCFNNVFYKSRSFIISN